MLVKYLVARESIDAIWAGGIELAESVDHDAHGLGVLVNEDGAAHAQGAAILA